MRLKLYVFFLGLMLSFVAIAQEELEMPLKRRSHIGISTMMPFPAFSKYDVKPLEVLYRIQTKDANRAWRFKTQLGMTRNLEKFKHFMT